MGIGDGQPRIYEFESIQPPTPYPFMTPPNDEDIALVCDNGTYCLRIGWAGERMPRMDFRNLVVRLRKDKDRMGKEFQVGSDIPSIEALRPNLRTAFERNILTQPDVQELVFDHAFGRLGLENDGQDCQRSILLTEPPCNLTYSRAILNEILFETYNMKQVSYTIDALMSLEYQDDPFKDGIIVSLGHSASHVLPILDGRLSGKGIKRIPVGGSHMIQYLFRQLQLKYPAYTNTITLTRAEELFHRLTHVPEDYFQYLNQWRSALFYANEVWRIQLPRQNTLSSADPEAVLNMRRAADERRKKQVTRLMEMHRIRREQELIRLREDLQQEKERFETLQDDLALGEVEESEVDAAALAIDKQELKVSQLEEKLAGGGAGDKKKERTPEELEEWLDGLRTKRAELLRRKATLQQRKEKFSRRKTQESLERMHLLFELGLEKKKSGGNGGSASGGPQKRSSTKGASGGGQEEEEEGFGDAEGDWDVYRKVSKDGWESEAELEQELAEVNRILSQYDSRDSDAASEQMEQDWNQLHFAVDQARVPEILFQPSLMGEGSAGIVEVLEDVLNAYPWEERKRLAENCSITGGLSRIPGMVGRFRKELRTIYPAEWDVRVSSTDPSVTCLAPWRAMSSLCASPDSEFRWTTKSEYLELGASSFKPHRFSNPR